MDKYTSKSFVYKIPFLDTFFGKNKNKKIYPTIRFYRFFIIILIHVLFIFSFKMDIQIIEGDISSSRIFGLHLADAFITFEVFLASHKLPVNLAIGAFTILGFYFLFGGRAFCSWVCPYSILGEIGEKINANFVHKKIIKQREFNKKFRYLFFIIFITLTFISGYMVFEIFNVVGILSRIIIYGYFNAFFIVLGIFLIEIFFSRRSWCRYICPIGTTYELICGHTNIFKISWNKKTCDNCNVCIDVCIVPHVLKNTKQKAKNEIAEIFTILGADCTLCGRCIDVCHNDSLKFENRLKKFL